jgi:antitoxin MazE
MGNSAAIRIPSSLMKQARLQIDQPVDVRVEGGRLIIDPFPVLDLDSLLARITDENLHGEMEPEHQVGREAL